MKKAFLLLLSALILGSPLSVQARTKSKWVLVATTFTGLTYVDANSIVRKGDIAEFSEIYKINDTSDGWEYSLTKTQINCKERTQDDLEAIYFDSNYQYIKTVSRKTILASKPDRSIPTESDRENTYNYVCRPNLF